MKAIRFALPSVILGLSISPVWAVEGGLPELEARVAVLEAALDAATGTVGQLQADLDAANAEINQLQSRVADVEGKLTCVSYDVVDSNLIFRGCNVHVQNDLGSTNSANGLGNLVIGYNADVLQNLNRGGSHNLILGDEQSYPNSSQLLGRFIGSNQDLMIESANNLNLNSGFDMQIAVGNDLSESVSNNRTSTVGSDLNSSVAQDAVIAVGGDLNKTVTQNLNVQAGQEVNVQGGDEISLKTGSALVLMKPNGDIGIEGRDILVEGSGQIDIKATGTLALRGSTITQN